MKQGSLIFRRPGILTIRPAAFMGGWLATLAMVICLGSQISFGYEKTDKPEGWASQSGGTTGGAGGTEVTVSTMAQLQAEAKSSGKKIIIVNKGTYTGKVVLASDKSILGKEPGVLIKGSISVSKVNNVIIRNLALQGDRCNSYDECKGGDDAMSVNSEAHHVWLDHLDISDGQDGNCDITNGSDFVTVTWSKFWYSYDKEHRFSNLIASDDNVAIDKGKLSITYAYCWWADRVVERQPRGRAGKVHVMNNLYTSSATNYICGPGVDIQMLIENNAMKTSGTAIKPFDGSPAPAWKSVGNIGTASNMATNQGTVFTPPYTMSGKMAAADVDAKVRPSAGNTLTLTTGTSGMIGNPRPPGTSAGGMHANPFVSASPEGWRLHNPGSVPVRYELLDAKGRRRDSQAILKAGQSALLPGGTAWKVRFTGSELAPIQLPD